MVRGRQNTFSVTRSPEQLHPFWHARGHVTTYSKGSIRLGKRHNFVPCHTSCAAREPMTWPRAYQQSYTDGCRRLSRIPHSAAPAPNKITEDALQSPEHNAWLLLSPSPYRDLDCQSRHRWMTNHSSDSKGSHHCSSLLYHQ
jgi:hypothetical protein